MLCVDVVAYSDVQCMWLQGEKSSKLLCNFQNDRRFLARFPVLTVSDSTSYRASGALPHRSLAFDFDIIIRHSVFSFTTFSK